MTAASGELTRTHYPATPKGGLTLREKAANRDGDAPWIVPAPTREQAVAALLEAPDTHLVKQLWLQYQERKGRDG